MEKVILHISDLHVTTHTKSNLSINKRIDSYLTTNVDESRSNHYLETFITLIKKDFSAHKIILLVTGDISNFGEKQEFEYAKKFLDKIIKELDIAIDQCLILPGDHDIHRRSIENELDINPTSEPYLLHSVKLKNFGVFYKDFKATEFPFEKIIIDHINIDNKLMLLGINSNYKIDNEGGEGFIPIQQFTDELNALKASLNDDQIQFVACWHHNLTAGYDDTNSGQWEPDNRRHLLAALMSQNIKLVITGNEHTSGSKNVLSIMTSDSGAFSSITYDAAFKVYPITIDDNIILENKIYGLQKVNGNDQEFFWNPRDHENAKQPDRFEIFIKNTEIFSDVVDDIPHVLTEDNVPDVEETAEDDAERTFYENDEFAKKLYSIIREKKLFHSGHFHWSESSRAHNWIDVSKLLEDHKDLYFVQNAIIDVICQFNLAENCDLLIGLGYEGNIISSKASIKYNIPYTSLPYSYRYEEHHDYEKKIGYENTDAKFKTVMIITDVVNDGRTIRKLIADLAKNFFENVERIIVVSLFYTGHEMINTDILNFDKLPDTHDFENDFEVNKIEYYTVKSLRVEKCPYGKEYQNECFIYKDELSCVHLFYDPELQTP